MNHNLGQGRVDLQEANLTIDRIVNEAGDHIAEQSPRTRFLYCQSPLVLHVLDDHLFVAERSVIKIQSGVSIEITADTGVPIYEITFTQDEKSYLDELKKDPFFNRLEGKAIEDWQQVRDREIDYVLAGERNSKNMVIIPGIIIAPPHSRRYQMVGNGWQLMYTRGSRAVGVGSDYIFQIRDQESLHSHRLITEVYICLGGEMALQVDDDEVLLRQDDVVALSPGLMRCMKNLVKTPYQGITLQTPSIPGDKVEKL